MSWLFKDCRLSGFNGFESPTESVVPKLTKAVAHLTTVVIRGRRVEIELPPGCTNYTLAVLENRVLIIPTGKIPEHPKRRLRKRRAARLR